VSGPVGVALAARAGAAAQVFVEDPEHPALADEDRQHLFAVLRLRAGESVVAADGAGRWCLCRVVHDDAGSLEPAGELQLDPPATSALVVAFAPAKGERPEWVVQKLTEVGVDRIVPLVTERSVVRWEGRRAERAEMRLTKVAKEAAAQSRRVWLPAVEPVTTLADFSERHGVDPGAVARAELGGPAPGPTLRAVAVGPEGGWSEAERATLGETVGLGDAVLRAETAAVAAGVLLGSLRAGTVAPGKAR
jgi:16S rRNA (uracil1498-N3)-methyltransferase